MNYDWQRTMPVEEGTGAFFDEIDRRFFNSSPFYHGARPFEDLIPFERLRGARVLEVGCGMGSHAQLLAQAGAILSAIDITKRATQMTRRRLELAGLTADVRQADAESLPFDDQRFDFVWSWGVVHHSASTEAVLREIVRVLKPGSEARLMVYHRHSIEAFGKVARGLFSGKLLRGMSVDDVLSHYSDGFLARHYTRRAFTELLQQAGFRGVHTRILGQRIELIPLPGRGPLGAMKRSLVRAVPDRMSTAVLSRLGWFLFATARR
jgi:ubiquinone/menaquinone biosynthesis C-methylase UbiE